MKYQIKPRRESIILYEGEAKTFAALVEAAVRERKNLTWASLAGANLVGADLTGADLTGADLTGVKGWHKDWTSLRLLLDQPGKIRAYKLVTATGQGPFNGGIVYEIGKTYEVKANVDETQSCAAGINLADLPWCLREWYPGYSVLIAEFEAKDIAAIPVNTDGKFRVHRCKIVGKKEIDPVALGLRKDPVEDI